jgi:hypothetical protein
MGVIKANKATKKEIGMKMRFLQWWFNNSTLKPRMELGNKAIRELITMDTIMLDIGLNK